MTSPIDILDTIDELAEKATDTPWGLRSTDGTLGPQGWYVVEEAGIDMSLCAIAPPENAAFIEGLVNAWPEISKRLRAAEAQAERYREALMAIQDGNGNYLQICYEALAKEPGNG